MIIILSKADLLECRRRKCLFYKFKALMMLDMITFSGSLSVIPFADVVFKDVFITNSEYLETIFVAVPK